jgi:excinuclease ABC subunit B
MTASMQSAIEETDRRRRVQQAYNLEHGIVPTTIQKGIRDLESAAAALGGQAAATQALDGETISDMKALLGRIKAVKAEMLAAAEALEFEKAARLRDELLALEKVQLAL